MTLSDLEAATQNPQDWDKLTKAQLKELRYQGETITERTMTRDAKTGDLGTLTEMTRDVLTNAMVGHRVTRWSYYSDGCVDEIAVSDFDAQGKETKRPKIKHFRDGRQPVTLSIVKKIEE